MISTARPNEYLFPLDKFTGTGDGCVEEVDRALSQIHEEKKTAKRILMSVDRVYELGQSVLASAGQSEVEISFNGKPAEPVDVAGGFLVSGYIQRETKKMLVIYRDMSVAENCFVVEVSE